MRSLEMVSKLVYVPISSEIDSDDIPVPLADDAYAASKGGSSSKGHKGKGSYYDGYDRFPSVGEINFLDDNFFDDHFFDGGDCQLVTLNETFALPRASRFLAPDTSPTNMGNPTLIGTVFIWEGQQVLELDGITPVDGTIVSGTCTRTVMDDHGMGSCQLIFVDDEEYSVNVNGLLSGPAGSLMAITGGTGGMVGVIGEMDFFPVFEGDVGDIFLNVTQYEVSADLGLVVCPH
jgi:hypothetical protein